MKPITQLVGEPAEGIVIRVYPSREADLVLRVVTTKYGKISFLAKHARKSKKRFGTTFDLFDKGFFSLGAGKGSLLLVDSFTPGTAYRKIRNDLTKISSASLICEVADFLTQEEEGEGMEPFHTIDLTLRAIDDAITEKETLKALYLGCSALLTLSGYGSPSSDETPSARRLIRLIQQVEESSGKVLESKSPIIEVLSSLSKRPHS